MIIKNKLNQIELFLNKSGIKSAKLMLLDGDASKRKYARIFDNDNSKILMDDQDCQNVNNFLNTTKIFKKLNLSVPEIYAVSLEDGLVLLEDFGDLTFNECLKKTHVHEYIYESAVDIITEIHSSEFSNNLKIYSTNQIIDEIKIFLDWAMLYFTGKNNYNDVTKNFLKKWLEIARFININSNVIVHYDYHADNLIWLGDRKGLNRVGILDYQDAIIGPPVYDLVSLLQDARVDVNKKLQSALIDRYLKNYKGKAKEFEYLYDCVAAQRNTRILGVFARLYLRDSKKNYLKYTERVINNLRENLKNPELKELKEFYEMLIPKQMHH